MFHTILIANRGEIACRIIKTARAMGIKTVAIYSTVDENSMHVRMADTALCVGDAAAKDSYLNIDSIIKAAKEAHAEAIHPGYGFLSENPKFAQACANAGIVFIGPTIDAIKAMASKQLSKQLLEKTAVPLTPGYHGKNQESAELLIEAKKIGFPVLIKAANGGGGKGMRAVTKEADFMDALASAKRESQASFSDDTMILEKLLLTPRHVEIQVMADNFGNIVHLFERDCSIQRRHQKIIEEAPAPNLSAKLRQKLATAACEVARAIEYRGAGTVEFLVDANEDFYFMEMNTRLQVEHPVTEMITGLDLVAWQLQIAAGEKLPLKQDQIKAHGHAFECRIYAEDPVNDFIPSIGTIHFLHQPKAYGVRIDTGIEQGSAISRYYDPMIAKLISHGSTRTEALQKMQLALANYYLDGVKTNIGFLQAIFENTNFEQAKFSTNFLQQETLHIPQLEHENVLAMIAAYDYLKIQNTLHDPLFIDTFAWQQPSWTWHYKIDNETQDLQIKPINLHEFIINNRHVQAQGYGNEIQIAIEKQHYKAIIVEHSNQIAIFTEQGRKFIERFNWGQADTNSSAHKGQLTAPMPSTVVAILKNIGDSVTAGDRLIVLEAMKMEHTIHAPIDGVLEQLFYPVGAQVDEGATLLTLTQPKA